MMDYQNEIEAQSYLEGGLEIEKILNNLINQGIDSQLNQDFFQDDNDDNSNSNNNKTVRKKSKPYNNTKVKARNFLTSIVYRRYKSSFIFILKKYFFRRCAFILDPKSKSNDIESKI